MPLIHPLRRWLPASLVLVLGLLLGTAPSACADIIISANPGGGNPAENLLFNASGLNLVGTTIQGATNQTSSVLDIGSNVSLTGNGGQADVTATSNNPYGAGGVSLIPHSANDLPAGLNPMGSFTDLKFNVEASGNGTLLIEAFNGNNLLAASDAFPISQNGSNWFRVTASGTDVISKVVLTTLDNTSSPTDLISNIQQIRLGGVAPPGPPPPVVPEPASLLLWGLAGGFGLLGYRLRRKSAPEPIV